MLQRGHCFLVTEVLHSRLKVLLVKEGLPEQLSTGLPPRQAMFVPRQIAFPVCFKLLRAVHGAVTGI